MNFRADLVINDDNTSAEMMKWFEDKYKGHSGSKRDFVRSLVNDLYQKEKEEKKLTITQKDLDHIKNEVLDYVLEHLGKEDLKDEISKKINGLNDLDDKQVNDQDKLLNQF